MWIVSGLTVMIARKIVKKTVTKKELYMAIELTDFQRSCLENSEYQDELLSRGHGHSKGCCHSRFCGCGGGRTCDRSHGGGTSCGCGRGPHCSVG